jgi:RNA polymerase sigma factor (TIGR02999 family)
VQGENAETIIVFSIYPRTKWYTGHNPDFGPLEVRFVKTTPGDVTRLLSEMKGGNRSAEERLIPLVYNELHRIASARLRNEAPHHSLQPTALVHEAYLKLTKLREIDWQSRSHFFAVSATLMRRILVDHARANQTKKRGEGGTFISLEDAMVPVPERELEILALNEALNKLTRLDERQSKIVELRFFAGMSEEETGEVLGISARTVKRDWRIAKAWLYAELHCH